jgi:TP901 family phage tail tape measure protein
VALPPAIQEFGIQAGSYLAGIDEMLEATDKLAASLDALAATADRLGGVFDGLGSADERLAAIEEAVNDQTKLLMESLGTMTGIMDEGAAASQRAADALESMTGSALRAGRAAAVAGGEGAAGLDAMAVSADRAGESVAVAGDASAAAGEKAAVFGGVMKTALLGVGIALAYGIGKAAGFQSSMEQLRTQAGVAQSKLAGLSQGVLQLAGQVGEGPDSLSQSLYHVASNMQSTGATGKQMLDAVKVAAEGAQVGNANLVDVTNALGAAIASGIPGVQNYTQAMGYMNATVGAGDMTMQDLSDAFGTGVLANIKQYGVTLQDVSAALATFGDNNIRGARAGTDLRMAVQSLERQGPAAAAALAHLGLSANSFADAMKNGGLDSALKLLIDRMKATGVTAKDQGQFITDLFGKRAGAGIGVLVGEFSRFEGKYKDVRKGADEFAGDWAARTKTMGQQWDDLKSGAQALAISFGSVLLPAATKVVGMLARFGDFLEKNPALAAFAGAILAVAAAFKIVATAEAVFDAVTDANPIMLAVIAVIALAAGLYELYRHFKIVRDIAADVGHFFEAAWKLAVEAAGAVIKWFVNGPLAFIKSQIAVFSKWWAQNGAEVKQVASEVWRAVSAVITTAWRLIWDGEIRPGLAILKAAWTLAWGLIRDTFKIVWDTIAAVTRVQVRLILDIISVVLDILTGKWGKAWQDLKKLASDALHGAVSVITAITSGFGTLLYDAGKALVGGLISGIEAMFGAVGNVIGDLRRAVVSAFTGGGASGGGAGGGISAASLLPAMIGSPVVTSLARAGVTAAVSAAAAGYGGDSGAGDSGLPGTGSSSSASYGPTAAQVADYGKIGVSITAAIGSGITETMGRAERAAAALMTGIRAQLAAGKITSGQAAGLTDSIESDLNSRQARLVTAMKKIGLDMGAGMLSSLEDATSASTAKTAVGKLISYVQQAWSAGDISTSRAAAMTSWLEADNTRLQGLAAHRQALLATIKTADAYEASTASSVQSWAGLSNIASSMTSGGMVYSGNILAGMKADLSSISQFTAAVKKLGHMGLRKDLLNQIIQMGPDQGLQVAEALLDGPGKVISEMNSTQAQIAAGSTALGQAAANAMYDTGKQAGKGFLSGLEAQESHVTAMMNRVAKSMAETLRRELGMDGKGGRGAGGGNVTVTVHGFIGSEQELVQELYKAIQQESLRHDKRNGTNGLSLTF